MPSNQPSSRPTSQPATQPNSQLIETKEEESISASSYAQVSSKYKLVKMRLVCVLISILLKKKKGGGEERRRRILRRTFSHNPRMQGMAFTHYLPYQLSSVTASLQNSPRSGISGKRLLRPPYASPVHFPWRGTPDAEANRSSLLRSQ